MNKIVGKKVIAPIAQRLRQARLESGFSQKKLGILAGIDEFSASPRMNQYETGRHCPDFVTLSKIADVLKIPTAYFYTEDDTLANLIKLYGSLDESGQKKLTRKLKD